VDKQQLRALGVGTTRSAEAIMAKTVHVPWRLLRPGSTVVGDRERDGEHKVVSVDHQGSTVSVLFWDGTREVHSEDAYTLVRLTESKVAARPTGEV
jgi:hypothetical protein